MSHRRIRRNRSPCKQECATDSASDGGGDDDCDDGRDASKEFPLLEGTAPASVVAAEAVREGESLAAEITSRHRCSSKAASRRCGVLLRCALVAARGRHTGASRSTSGGDARAAHVRDEAVMAGEEGETAAEGEVATDRARFLSTASLTERSPVPAPSADEASLTGEDSDGASSSTVAGGERVCLPRRSTAAESV